jgi:hypothetical protein
VAIRGWTSSSQHDEIGAAIAWIEEAVQAARPDGNRIDNPNGPEDDLAFMRGTNQALILPAFGSAYGSHAATSGRHRSCTSGGTMKCAVRRARVSTT